MIYDYNQRNTTNFAPARNSPIANTIVVHKENPENVVPIITQSPRRTLDYFQTSPTSQLAQPIVINTQNTPKNERILQSNQVVLSPVRVGNLESIMASSPNNIYRHQLNISSSPNRIDASLHGSFKASRILYQPPTYGNSTLVDPGFKKNNLLIFFL
jgi:hypothetical protein